MKQNQLGRVRSGRDSTGLSSESRVSRRRARQRGRSGQTSAAKIGTLKSSARVTDLYSIDELLNRQIVGVVNFHPKQIGPFRSEFLLAGFYRADGEVVLAIPERRVSDGARLG